MMRLIFIIALTFLCGAASAQTPAQRMILFHQNPAPVSGGGPASYTPVYGNSQNLGFGSNTYTSPSQTWGAGRAVVSFYGDAANVDLSVTIKGVSATQVGTYSGTGHRCSLWIATVSAGSGTVVAVSSGGVLDGVSTAGGVVTTTTPTPSGFDIEDMIVAAEPQSVVTVTIPTSGIGVFFAASGFGSATTLPLTWTVATRDAITESFTTPSAPSSSVGGGAHSTTPGSTTPGVSTSDGTMNFTGTTGCMTAVAFSP